MIDLTGVFKGLIAKGQAMSSQDIQQITPYVTAHIKRYGEFVIDLSKTFAVTDDDLRLPDSLLPAS